MTETKAPLEIGYDQMRAAVGGRDDTLLDRLVQETGIYGLTYFIKRVLDEHYPSDVFPVELPTGSILYPTWGSERGGEDIDPGVKWIALLREAIGQVDR